MDILYTIGIFMWVLGILLLIFYKDSENALAVIIGLQSFPSGVGAGFMISELFLKN